MGRDSAVPAVSAVVINFNGGPFLKDCLESLLAQTHRPVETLVVDNRSTDDSAALVRREFPGVRLLEQPRNLGYAGAANVAVRETRAPWLLLLNADVLLAPTFLEALAGFAAAHPDAGSLTGKLLRFPVGPDPATIDSAGHWLLRSRWAVNRGEGEADRGQYDAPAEVFGVSGAAPLYRRAMLEDVRVDDEVFAESFFLYLEDVDLDWRARLRGWKAYCVPAAVAHHARGYKSGLRPRDPGILRHSLKNRYLLMLRNDAVLDVARDLWAILPIEALRLVDFLLTEPRAALGYLDVVRLLPATLRQRRFIGGRVRVASGELRAWRRAAPRGGLVRARARLRLAGRGS